MARHLLLLSGLAVIGAVVNHALGWGFTALFWWTDRYASVAVPDFSQLGTASYFTLRVAEQIVVVSVPAFLFVSGYFIAFATGRDRAPSWGRIRGRLKTLLIPYVLWSLVIFALRGLEGTTDTPGGYLRQLLFGRAAAPFYYVPLLTQLYLLAPVLVVAVRARASLVLWTVAILQVVVQAARYPLWLGWDLPAARWISQHSPGWFFPQMVFWFVLGIHVGFAKPELRARLARWRPVLPWLTLALGALGVAEWERLQRASAGRWLDSTPTALDSLFCCAFILTFLAYAEWWAPKRGRLDALGERSYGVYLVHAPVLEVVARTCYHVAPVVLAHQILFQPVLVTAGLAVPLLLMALVRRSPARRSYNFLFG